MVRVMSGSWRLTAFADRASVEAVLAAQELAADWDGELVLTACEMTEDRVDGWRLDAYLPRPFDDDDKAAIAALFGNNPPNFHVEQLPDTDWITESQRGMEPVHVGRFTVRTPDAPSIHSTNGTDLIIPAAQAFGTGQHATTEGCLAVLDGMERLGVRPLNIIDVGTGTGLLAFAALRLWPEARITASDIDPVCEDVLLENAALNGVALGPGVGQVHIVIAPGLDHPALTDRAPYNLLIANILAGPLMELAPQFARHVAADGNIILSGLLTSQKQQVVTAYEEAGFCLSEANSIGDWAILRLCKHTPPADHLFTVSCAGGAPDYSLLEHPISSPHGSAPACRVTAGGRSPPSA